MSSTIGKAERTALERHMLHVLQELLQRLLLPAKHCHLCQANSQSCSWGGFPRYGRHVLWQAARSTSALRAVSRALRFWYDARAVVLLRSRLCAEELHIWQHARKGTVFSKSKVHPQAHLCATASSAVRNLYLGFAPRMRLRWSSGRPFTCPAGAAMASMRPAMNTHNRCCAWEWPACTGLARPAPPATKRTGNKGQRGVVAARAAALPPAVQPDVAARHGRTRGGRPQAPQHGGQHVRAAGVGVAAAQGGAC